MFETDFPFKQHSKQIKGFPMPRSELYYLDQESADKIKKTGYSPHRGIPRFFVLQSSESERKTGIDAEIFCGIIQAN